MTQSNRICILGAGSLGIKLGLELASCGHSVVGIRRNPQHIPKPIIGVAGDLHNPSGLVSHWLKYLPPEGGELCVILTPDGYTEAAYRKVFVEGLINLVESLKAANVRPAITFVSSTSVYGSLEGEVTEMSQPQPKTATSKVLLDAENWLLQQDFPLTRVRFAGIYGPSRTRLVDLVRAGEVTGIANMPTNRIHERDCAGLLRCVIRTRFSGLHVPPLINGVDDDQATLGQVCAFIARKLGKPLPRFDGVPSKRAGNRWVQSLGVDELNYQLVYPDHMSGYTQVINEAP